jgi:hypothetical protein
LEPASGQLAIVRVLEARGFSVCHADIRGIHGPSVDFLGSTYGNAMMPNVITNPPFKKAEQFVKQALIVAHRRVAMFLRLQFLEGAKRVAWLQGTPLEWVLPFASRVTTWPEGTEEPEYAGRGGTAAYAWFVWTIGYSGHPKIKWITARGPRPAKVRRSPSVRSEPEQPRLLPAG